MAPWANTALLVVLLLALTPVIAARLGSVPASLFALGCVAVYPFYDFFTVGYFDHHGVAAMACMMVVLLLVAGGAGWVRAEEVETGKAGAEERVLSDWLPTRGAARRWFVASGLIGAIGLWISAAAMAPVLLVTGLGALVAFMACGRGGAARAAWSLDPSLFRVWGIAGAAGSVAFYLLEYFPSHMGMRLEVNHPLYALAFFGGGDLLARIGERLHARPTPGDAPRDAAPRAAAIGWVAFDAALILCLPAVVLITGESTFRLVDRFLWTIHNRFIVEFLGLNAWLLNLSPRQIAGQVSLVPLASLLVAAVLWPSELTGRWRLAWRAVLVVAVGAGAAYGFVFLSRLTGGNLAAAVLGTAVMTGLWFLLPLPGRTPALAPPWQGALVLALMPALSMLIVALVQMRWMGNAAALSLGVVVVVAAVLIRSDHVLLRNMTGRAATGALALTVLVLQPALTVTEPFVRPNADVIASDASHWLRRRLGDQAGVILAGPTPTTQMIWFGGFRGLGTLYWENLDGLRVSQAIYGAPDADSARALLARYGVTHVVFYGWDGGLEQLEGSAREADGEGASSESFLGAIERALRAGQPVSLPPWLTPLPYVPPTVAGYHHPVAQILEVGDLPPEIALARLAQFHKAMEDGPGVEESLARSLAIGPSVPALAMMAEIQRLKGERPAFLATLDLLRAELSRSPALDLGDRVDAAIALGLGGDGQGVSIQLSAALAQADDRQLRRLAPERLSLMIDLSRQLGLDGAYPDAIALAERVLRQR